MIATTLRRLDRDRVCLCPKKKGDLDTLIALALKTLRFQWHLTSRRDYGRAQKRVGLSAIEEIEATSGDRWHPRCDRFGGGSTLSGDRGRFPGDDLLAGETGRALVSVLENEFGLSRERALAVILLCYLPSFRVLVEALETLGCTDFSPSYLKKWTEKELPLLHLRLRDVLCDWGIASPNNAPSSL